MRVGMQRVRRTPLALSIVLLLLLLVLTHTSYPPPILRRCIHPGMLHVVLMP